MTEEFDPIKDAWRSLWEAMALTDPRSTVAPDVAVERHRGWCKKNDD